MGKNKKMYSSYVLDEKSKNDVLTVIKPRFDKIVCHHITYNYPDNNSPPNVDNVLVIGEVWDEHMQGLLVRIDEKSFRPDGKKYHITFSHDENVKPVYCNKIMDEMKNVRFLDKPLKITVKPSLSR